MRELPDELGELVVDPGPERRDEDGEEGNMFDRLRRCLTGALVESAPPEPLTADDFWKAIEQMEESARGHA